MSNISFLHSKTYTLNAVIKPKRVSFLDIAKAVAIILVVVGHCEKYNFYELRVWICSFHMPLFWILTGITFSSKRHTSYFSFVKSKVKTLLIPYYCLSFILLFLESLFFSKMNSVYILSKLKAIFIADRLSGNYYSMWFITSLFFAVLIYYFIDKYIKNKYLLWTTSFLMLGVGYLIFKYIKGFYYSIDTVPIVICFIIVGKSLKNFVLSEMTKKRMLVIIVVSLFINAVSCYLDNFYFSNYSTAIFASTINNPILFFISSLSGSLAVIFASKFIGKFPLLEYFGKYTLIIYAFQNTLLIPISYKIIVFIQTKLSIEDSNIVYIINLTLCIVIVLLLSTVLIEILKGLLPFTIGGNFKKKIKS